MYAIIKAGGKQYTVKPGDVLRVEKLEAELGAEINFTDVLMVGGEKTFVGESMGKAVVTVVVTNQQRGPKVIIFKKKRRQGYRRTGGHRQPYTELFVKSITSPEGQTVKADGKAQVYNPEKKAANVAKAAEAKEQYRIAARAAKKSGGAAPVTEAKTRKPAAKKAAAKTTAKKKTATKKPAAKKATAKKTAKK
jgi:large subunit ribosomal protein L21